MYWTPWARLMKSITPKTSVSPAAIRNSRTPSCRPLRIWSRRRAADISLAPRPGTSSFHRAILDVRVGIVLEHLLDDLGLELAVGAFGDLDQVEVLDRIVIGVEPEAAAQRLEVGLLQRNAQRVLVGEVALDGADRAVDQQRGVIGLECIARRHGAVFLLVGCDEQLVLRVVEIGRPVGAAEHSERGVLLRGKRRFVDGE